MDHILKSINHFYLYSLSLLNRNRKISIPILIFVVIVIGFSSTFLFENEKRVEPRTGPIIEAVYGLGTVVSRKIFHLKIGVISSISKLYVKEGDLVKSGTLLADLEGNVFRAPFTGTITSLPFKVSESVFPQVPIMTMEDMKDLYIVVSLEQQAALRVKKDQNARVIFESLRGQKFIGKVRTIFPSEGQFIVHIDMDNLPPEILPGMTADVAIEIGKKENALLIPLGSISGGKVHLVRDGHTKKVEVQIGIVDGEWAEVVSGDVKPTDKIIPGKN